MWVFSLWLRVKVKPTGILIVLKNAWLGLRRMRQVKTGKHCQVRYAYAGVPIVVKLVSVTWALAAESCSGFSLFALAPNLTDIIRDSPNRDIPSRRAILVVYVPTNPRIKVILCVTDCVNNSGKKSTGH